MGNYKFYTPPEVAECLMTVLPEKKYKNVIDEYYGAAEPPVRCGEVLPQLSVF